MAMRATAQTEPACRRMASTEGDTVLPNGVGALSRRGIARKEAALAAFRPFTPSRPDPRPDEAQNAGRAQSRVAMSQDDKARRRYVTLEEVARMAGVSRATGSRVVNGSPKVSPDARRSVEDAVARLGYVPNRAARSLVTRRSDSIGVIIPESTTRLFGDPFFHLFLNGIGSALGNRGLQLVLLMPQSGEEEKRLEQFVAAGHIDGVVLTALHGDDPLPERLAARGVPVVVNGRPPRGARASYVDADSRGGGKAAAAHLLAQGRRRLATISGSLDMPAAMDRLLGFRDALEAAGLQVDPTLEEVGNFSPEGAARAMNQLLERRPDLDAVFVASDSMAVTALGELQASGRRVPDDVAVVGFDDQPIARTTRPPLSSVRHPIEAMSQEMIRLLLQSIDARDQLPKHVVFSTELVVRESSGGVSTNS
jgi:DNA-binding LacI/PurR family transcriptional regulator